MNNSIRSPMRSPMCSPTLLNTIRLHRRDGTMDPRTMGRSTTGYRCRRYGPSTRDRSSVIRGNVPDGCCSRTRLPRHPCSRVYIRRRSQGRTGWPASCPSWLQQQSRQLLQLYLQRLCDVRDGCTRPRHAECLCGSLPRRRTRLLPRRRHTRRQSCAAAVYCRSGRSYRSWTFGRNTSRHHHPAP